MARTVTARQLLVWQAARARAPEHSSWAPRVA
jgi:hypothetical protein